jgi:hypothetical protein
VEQRYVCRDCSIKWFVPGEHEPRLTTCEACGGELVPLDARFGGDVRPVFPGESSERDDGG